MFAPRFACCAAILAAMIYLPLPALPGQTSLPIFGADTSNPVERVLAERTTIELEDQVTLKHFVQFLRKTYRINVVLDHRALDDVGLGSDTPMPGAQYEGVLLDDALTMILEQLDLCFMVRNVVLVITTPEEAENNLSTHVYPVGDILHWTKMQGALYGDFDTLIELITSAIAMDTWDDVGGAGAIEPHPYTQSLVISQTRDVHKKVRALIETLRKANNLQPAPRAQELPAGGVGSVPYRPGATPAGGVWNQPQF